jgi:hypothetical protein
MSDERFSKIFVTGMVIVFIITFAILIYHAFY